MPKHARRAIRPSRIAPALLVAGALVAGCQRGADSGGAPQGVAVSVAPPTTAVAPGAGQVFVARVTGSADLSVTWSVPDASCGSITGAGAYTAPGAPATCRVVATSNADPGKAATADVTITSAPTANTIWQPLKVGAGGWVTGIDACKAGTTYVLRTDTYGGYVGNPNAAQPWRQLVRADTMPASFVAQMGSTLGEGVYEVRVAPSDCARLYMAYKNRIYRSTDRGTTWTPTAFSYSGAMDPNDGYRSWGEKMAVDPADPGHVFAGTPRGLFVTTDGGASWSLVTGVPTPTSPAGITGIVFDESSGLAGGWTRTLYAAANGVGVYRSNDGGATWSALIGGPGTVEHAAVATDGAYYAVNMGTSAYVFAGGSWRTTASTGSTLHSIATDPANPARIVVGRDSGHLAVSTDRGASWGAGVIWNVTRTATDVPWLAFANEPYMSNGAMRFDPVVPGKLWFTEGIGVWSTSAPENPAGTTWVSYSAGIEQLVARDVCVPPGSANVVLAGMDRSVWVVPAANTSYPSRYVTMGSTAPLIAAWSVAYSRANPSHLVAIINRGISGEPEMSGYSLDGGATWTRFPVQPGTGGQSGDVVAPSIDDIIAVIGNRYAYRSTDRGASWTPLSLPGDGGADTANLHCGYNCKKHVLAVDGADPATIYLYFYGRGLYRSTDRGASWALVSTNAFDGGNMYWQVKLRAVPGQAGHLFLTAGQSGGLTDPNPANTFLWRSTDGGVTWTKLQNHDQSQGAANERIAEPYDVAAGKAAPGHAYPAIYFAGWYRATTSSPWEYGIWRSVDFDTRPADPTWTLVGPFPFGSVDEINVLAASQDVFGDLYAAFGGSGWGAGRSQ